MRRRAVLVLLLVSALGLSACGPTQHVQLSLRNYVSNLTYGGEKTPAPAPPVSGASLTPTFPSFIQPPAVLTPTPTPAPTPVAPLPSVTASCPSAGPDSFPAVQASSRVPGPPSPGTYFFRQTGHYDMDGQSGTAASQVIRVVTDVATQSDGDYTFDVDEANGNVLTQTSYEVQQTTGSTSTDGLYITGVITKEADGTIDQFSPEPAIRIMPLPASAAQTQFTSAGVDPIHGVTEEISGTMEGHTDVNACGTVLDSWQVQVTGKIISASESLDLTASYDIGTQFGGLSLADMVTLTGKDSDGTVDQTSTDIIDSAPPVAGGS